MHAIYQHFSELIEQAVIQLCPNLFLNFPAAAELQVHSSINVNNNKQQQDQRSLDAIEGKNKNQVALTLLTSRDLTKAFF